MTRQIWKNHPKFNSLLVDQVKTMANLLRRANTSRPDQADDLRAALTALQREVAALAGQVRNNRTN